MNSSSNAPFIPGGDLPALAWMPWSRVETPAADSSKNDKPTLPSHLERVNLSRKVR